MTEPLNGLRFDIYERVHLPDDAAGIEELEEIEMVPRMQVQTQEDQVMLRGHLLLTGVYRPQEQNAGVSKLEHSIPVEITLPQNRVERLENLSVEIDNFDVDLLSTRSLNVTGVLALRGLQSEAPQVPAWRDDSFTVVHQAPAANELEEIPDVQDLRSDRQSEADGGPVQDREPDREPGREPGRSGSDPVPASFDAADFFAVPSTSPYYAVPDAREAGVWPYAFKAEPVQPHAEPNTAAPERNKPSEAADFTQVPEASEGQKPFPAPEWPSETGWGDLSARKPAEPDAFLPAEIPAVEEKPELKVAFGTKLPETPAKIPSGVGWLSQLGEKGAVREAEQQAIRSAKAAAEEEADAARSSTGDELEWTKLFLSSGADAQPFQRVKMCIVQREETLDSIAARYNVQPREIQLRNRLADPYLSHGQVLYIP